MAWSLQVEQVADWLASDAHLWLHSAGIVSACYYALCFYGGSRDGTQAFMISRQAFYSTSHLFSLCNLQSYVILPIFAFKNKTSICLRFLTYTQCRLWCQVLGCSSVLGRRYTPVPVTKSLPPPSTQGQGSLPPSSVIVWEGCKNPALERTSQENGRPLTANLRGLVQRSLGMLCVLTSDLV